jgi:hypothetical protein
MVPPVELPAGWGLMAPRAGRLCTVVKAAKNRSPLALTPSRTAALVRAAVKTAEARTRDEYNKLRVLPQGGR